MADHHSKIKDSVYQQAIEQGPEALYQTWANQYDKDNATLGFCLPQIAAGFVARYINDKDARILDAGCGTGLVGLSLDVLGYTNINGLDISDAMLDCARSRNTYQELGLHELGSAPLPLPPNSLDALLCIGCMGPGHVQPSALDHFIAPCTQGARIFFNVVKNTYEEQGFPEKFNELIDAGKWRLLEESKPFRPYHIGEPDLLSILYVFEVL